MPKQDFQRRLTLALLLVAASGACSKSDSPGTSPTGGTGGSGQPGAVGAATSCAKSQIEILFSPMFSAFDGVHRFQVPATVNGIDPAAITWSISDPSIGSLQTNEDGVMITVQKAGTANLIATAGSLCGSAPLTVTAATADHWMVGSARYTSGQVLTVGMGGGGGPRPPGQGPDGGAGGGGMATRDVACTSCHGDTATAGPFKTVSHTPMQTAGFSDDQLIKIFTAGELPANAYFDDTIVPRQQWSNFHRWTMTPEQATAMVIYLRSLTPESQKGSRADFGGRQMRPDGGFGRGDGGGDGGRRGMRDGGDDAPTD
jgi:hypothetical protein